MVRIGWENRLNEFRQEVSLIGRRAREYSYKSKELQKQAECCKVHVLTYELEEKRNALAHSKGFTCVVTRKKIMPVVLGIAATSILMGIITKDKFGSASDGLSGLSGTFRKIGETDWVVLLERQLEIVPQDNISPGKVWYTWDSIKAALIELEHRAKNGTPLGNLDSIIAELRRSESLVPIRKQIYYAVSKTEFVAVARKGTGGNWLGVPEVVSEDASGILTPATDPKQAPKSL